MKRPAFLWATLMLAALALPQLACAQDDIQPEYVLSSYRAGRYAEAVELGRALLQTTPQDRATRIVVIESLAAIGHYEPALEEAASLPVQRGQVLMEVGRYEEARAEFERAIQEGDPDRLTAELNLAVLQFEQGERDAAMQRFDRFIDIYNENRDLPANDLIAVGIAVRHLGLRRPELFHDAVKAYDEAITRDPASLLPRVLLGEMFIDKYDSEQAQRAFEEVFAINPVHPRALVGLARAKHFDGDAATAFDLAMQSLQINYQYVPALVLLARLKIESENPAAAEEDAQRALQVNPRSLEALTILGTIRYLEGDQRGYEEIRDRVTALNPTYGDFYVTIAEVAAQHRRYADAADMARLAVETDPESWPGYGTLGINELRLGRVQEAQANLERSFDGDPFNIWIFNTLDLLDTFDDYELISSPRFVFMLHHDEAELLFPYLSALAEEAYDSLAVRYGHEPATPIRVEVYPRHQDFSVRTVGLTGLGALGVAFGGVLAMDSPAAREPGQLNWGATLWHELAHTMALELSNSRVPRWFTEGLSVFEERRARPGWGSETTADFMLAYAAGEIPPLSRLNEGFVRPPSPRHLGLAYHGASLAIEWIEETRGFPAIIQMLREYGAGRGDADVLQTVLGAEPDQLDEEFNRWLRQRYPDDGVRAYRDRLVEAQRSMQSGDFAAAEQQLGGAGDLFVDADPTLPALLGRIRLEQGDTAGAITAYSRAAAIDETAHGVNVALAELAEAQGDDALLIESLERVMFIHPYDISHHRRLAEAYGRLGESDGVVRARRAVVALRPVDQAEALYQLATALRDAGNPTEARRQVVRALELAPAFERAQELLLELSEGT